MYDSASTGRNKALRLASPALQAYHLLQAIVEEGNECVINGIKVQIKPHTNKDQHDMSNSQCRLASRAHAASALVSLDTCLETMCCIGIIREGRTVQHGCPSHQNLKPL